MKCHYCKGGHEMKEVCENYRLSKSYGLPNFVVKNLKMEKCPNCGNILFSEESCTMLDLEIDRERSNRIANLPIGDFITPEKTADILFVSHQRLSRWNRAQRMIYHTKIGGRKFYNLKSVLLFKESSNLDGRFVLSEVNDKLEEQYGK